MKKFKLLGTMSLSAAMLLSVITACAPSTAKPGEGEVVIDNKKTTLFVSNFNGAYGDSWLKAAASRYEELHANDSYEAGKKGVQIYIDNGKEDAKTLIAGINGSRDDVFFTEWLYYYDVVNSGKVMDLTDIVTEQLTDYGESVSIEDKLTSEQKNYYSIDGHYYALPHYQAFSGITYDVELFEDELLYFAYDKDNGNDGFITSSEDKRAYGPDGKTGVIGGVDYSSDDGLPATYDDFFKLCAKMREKGITPLLWTGSYPIYYQWFSTALYADYEGLENMMLNYTFDGTADDIVTSFDTDGNPILSSKEIKPSTGYELAKQAGRYYSLKFTEGIVNGNYTDARCFGTLEFIEAQKVYINGGYGGNQRIGMFIESNYWENEVSDANGFATMVKQYGQKAGRLQRKFSMMPFPKATEEQVGEKNTLVDFLMSGAFIKKDIADYKKELALDFLQYLYTDESLNEWTAITGTPKSVKYDLTEETESQISYFSKSVFALRNASDVVYPYSNSALYKNNASSFSIESFWNASVSNTPYSYPQTAIKKYRVSARDYFNGIAAVNNQNAWNNSYSKYFEN